MKSVYENKAKCSGCSACNQICPKSAITMIQDKEGFLYPDINQELCIDCGLCKAVCPMINNTFIKDNKLERNRVYGIKHQSEEVVNNSTSGGVFTALTNSILQDQGVVYGVAYSDDFKVRHIRGTSDLERNKMRGSKYVQSDKEDTFRMVYDDLKNGRKVLFSGTGCDIAGLRKYLEIKKVNTENLILVDLICYGTPSPKVWDDYLAFIQKGGKIIDFSFRDKRKGWRGFNVSATYEDGHNDINTPALLSYIHLFGAALSLRPSCYACPYTSTQRNSDIMIGDFWGIEKINRHYDDNKGASLVYANSEKGLKLIEEVLKECQFFESNIEDSLQQGVMHPTKKPYKREEFWEAYYKGGYLSVAKKYGGLSIHGQIRKRLGKVKRALKGE